jgi:hypothetical protein
VELLLADSAADDGARAIGADADVGFAWSGGGDGAGAGRAQGGTGSMANAAKFCSTDSGGAQNCLRWTAHWGSQVLWEFHRYISMARADDVASYLTINNAVRGGNHERQALPDDCCRDLAKSNDPHRYILIERHIDEYLKADPSVLPTRLSDFAKLSTTKRLERRDGEDWSIARRYVRSLLSRMT